MLISVHVPKTAGISFRTWLQSAYAADSIVLDYADRPVDPLSPMHVDRPGFLARSRNYLPDSGTQVIHGHFWIKKYEHLSGTRIAFLRHPIERALSHFYYWKSAPPHGHSLHEIVRRPEFEFHEFVRLPMIARFYTEVFFADVEMSSFDFIGDFAKFESECRASKPCSAGPVPG